MRWLQSLSFPLRFLPIFCCSFSTEASLLKVRHSFAGTLVTLIGDGLIELVNEPQATSWGYALCDVAAVYALI